jgi:hypothetical protein
MRLPDETFATNASENMSVFAPHFQQVYNNYRPVDPHFVKHVTQQRMLWELNDPITWEEFTKAVKKLKMRKLLSSPEYLLRCSKPCLPAIYAMSSNISTTSSLARPITSNGIAVNAYQF